VTLGWSLFYFTDLSRLTTFFQILFGYGNAEMMGVTTMNDLSSHALWLVLAVLWCMPLGQWLQDKIQWLRFAHWRPSTQSVLLLIVDSVLLFSSTALLVGQSYNPFIYFRF
jgi:alginate O-acetyltransferase complex protein AlgI